jgi:hypothetical protein
MILSDGQALKNRSIIIDLFPKRRNIIRQR